MKFNKILCLVFALLMVFALAACGDKKDNGGNNDGGTQAGKSVIGTVINIDDYQAVVTDTKLVKDDAGKDVLAITYDYTNNSEEEESFMWAFFYELKQNGTALESATVFVSEDSFDFLDDALYDSVQPGDTLSVTMTYTLIDTKTPVEVEFSDLLSEELVTFTVDVASL